MRYAKNEQGQLVEAAPDRKARCPSCDDEVIARCGEINAHHWAHRRTDCDPWSEPMSAWHVWWQQQFPLSQREVVIDRAGVRHRADVVVGHGGVLELQASHLPVAQIREREQFYGHMAWLFRCSWANNLWKQVRACRCVECLEVHPALHERAQGFPCPCRDCSPTMRAFQPPPDARHDERARYRWAYPRPTLAHVEAPQFWHLEDRAKVWQVTIRDNRGQRPSGFKQQQEYRMPLVDAFVVTVEREYSVDAFVAALLRRKAQRAARVP